MNSSICTHFGIEFMEDDFTIISNLLQFLEPFAVLCVLLSSDGYTSKYATHLITNLKQLFQM